MSIERIFRKNVVTVSEDQSIVEVAALMRDHSIGDVIVVDRADGMMRPIGILTDRDIVTGCVAENVDEIQDCKVQDLMTRDPLCIETRAEIYDCLMKMQQRGVGRCPVVDESGRLVGVLTTNHICEFISRELSALAGISAAHKESVHAARSYDSSTMRSGAADTMSSQLQ